MAQALGYFHKIEKIIISDPVVKIALMWFIDQLYTKLKKGPSMSVWKKYLCKRDLYISF